MNDLITIIDWFDKKMPLYEKMLEEEYEKKKRGEPYEVLYRSVEIPFAIFDDEITWVAKELKMSSEEFKNVYGKR